MTDKKIKIVVNGDLCIQNLQWRTAESNSVNYQWQTYPQIHSTVKLGHDFLLPRLVSMATGMKVLSPTMNPCDQELLTKVLHSKAELELFPKTSTDKSGEKVYRISQYLGFDGPESGMPGVFHLDSDDRDAEMVVLDDENNGFNQCEQDWPEAVRNTEHPPIIIYKTNNFREDNRLLSYLIKNQLEQTIVVINADDLRFNGVNISKSISWERTSLDFVWQMENNQNISQLAKCRNLIILFGVEGAIHYSKEEDKKSRLYFLTYEFEGDFIREELGKMYGLTSCFVAGLARNITSGIQNEDLLEHSISEGIREGIVAAHKYFVEGFGADVKNSTFPGEHIFQEAEHDFIYSEQVQDVNIRNTRNPNCQACWYIVKDKNSINVAEISFDIVKNGEKSALKYMPIAQFGNLKTVDRTEIEGYRSIKNLIADYIATPKSIRPLSIAVFGTPGSGKSFGVTEIASSIAPNLIEKLDFNLSQFRDATDLVAAFHKVRDLSLSEKLPLVFFDEFDSGYQGKLGWLKYFLSPMQDGLFREGEAVHPIGKAIFVFAGGTSNTFDSFCGEELEEEEEKVFRREFQAAKGPDFISRLRGYVNILGPNQTDKDWDQLFIIRRAMLLRSLIERKVPYLINGNGEAQIDNGVLRALLKVPMYKHESRSMEAILEMSILSSAKKWEQSNLPSKDQLKLHVDEEQFSRLLMQEAFFSEKIEKMCKELLLKQKFFCEKAVSSRLNSMTDYEQLTKEEKKYIGNHVKHIPIALQRINYEVISVKEKPELISFTDKELNILGEAEHKRNALEMKEKGWVYGLVFDERKKTLPTLASWEKLTKEYRNDIKENIKMWPEILANSSFTIERLQYLCKCEAQLIKK